jgi:hypothetical protein
MRFFSFITLRHHEELAAELRRQFAERSEECHKWQDLFTRRATGRALWEEPEPEQVSVTAVQPETDIEPTQPTARAAWAL